MSTTTASLRRLLWDAPVKFLLTSMRTELGMMADKWLIKMAKAAVTGKGISPWG